VKVTSPGTFPAANSFDRLYRGEPSVDGGPKPAGIPWDVHQAQPRLMELEALGGFTGEVLDIGCGLGDNTIFLASRGHLVTGLDGSPAAIEQARIRAAEAGVSVTFGVADAANLTGYDGRFDTVLDSALYHCLDEDSRQAYAAGLHRATRPGARWHLYCFSDGNVNGMIAPMGAAPEVVDALLHGPRTSDRTFATLSPPMAGGSTSSAQPPTWPMSARSPAISTIYPNNCARRPHPRRWNRCAVSTTGSPLS
jgi:SAM-dependent methyltransferase